LSKNLAAQFHEKGVACLDAPVTGGRERADISVKDSPR